MNRSATPVHSANVPVKDFLKTSYQTVRQFSHFLCEPLSREDYVVQSMPDASPTKWHLAHTSWFFETFVLSKEVPKYRSINPQFNYLFNSYYVQIGDRFSRPDRGLLSRPTVDEVYAYRRYVDEHMIDFVERSDESTLRRILPVMELGLNHEQQHQELILTDIKHMLSTNPLSPIYKNLAASTAPGRQVPLKWHSFVAGVRQIGHTGPGFAFDNESPRHKVYLQDFRIASRLVTNGEFANFINDRAYSRQELWLSDGAKTVEEKGWGAPAYWHNIDGQWKIFTLHGLVDLDPNEPVCHVSYFEADAYARWAGARLPTESEWEVASEDSELKGHFAEEGIFHPRGMNEQSAAGINQMFGDVWEWTQSPYTAYPGFRPAEGAIGEYNGKFMCNQLILRGGSCATSSSHIRRTYRNFFPAEARWQFTGIRLAND